MNSKQFTTTSGKIISEIMSNKRNFCNEYSFNDNSPLYIKKQEPSSKELKLVFDFMEKIIKLTSGFWQSLGVNNNLKHLLEEQNNSFSILDSENCKILNFYYRSIIISLSQYQIDMLGKQNFYASFYIKNAFERIEEFLTPTLPLFKKNIESVQFNILSKHNKFNSTSRIYKFKNTGSYINTRISEYLNKLESAIFKFEPKNVTSQYEKKRRSEGN